MRTEGFLRTSTYDELKQHKDNPTGISLFTGAGGADIGFSEAGFKTRVMVEMSKDCCQTLRANWFWSELKKRTKDRKPKGKPIWKTKAKMEKSIRWYHMPEPVILERDIMTLTTEEILEAGNLKVGEASIVFGGSPCQGFSMIGKRNIDDSRNKLILEFWRVVNEAMPRLFFFENVPGFVYGNNYKLLIEFADKLSNSGYDVCWDILNAADYGVPQHRKRVIMIGKRIDLMYPDFESGRIKYHIACMSGEVRHPDWFIKKHKLKENIQKSLDLFKQPKTIMELLKSMVK